MDSVVIEIVADSTHARTLGVRKEFETRLPLSGLQVGAPDPSGGLPSWITGAFLDRTTATHEEPAILIVVIDPEGLVKDGCFVVAQHDNEFYFRQLVIEGERYLLKCLNHDYDEVVEISGLDEIHGVVSQKAGTRRKDRKRYD